MSFNHFFRASWMTQLLVGIGLFSVSVFIENQVMQGFLSAPMMALCLTMTLEIGKAVAIIWHRYMVMRPGLYPLSTRIASGVFRIGLVVLSLLCSLLFLADHLDRPHLESVRTVDLQHVQTQFINAIEHLDSQIANQQTVLQNKQKDEINTIRQSHTPRIKQLQTALSNEMSNVVNGTFKGPRYKEYERLLNDETMALASDLDTTSARHLQETEVFDLTLRKETTLARKAAVEKSERQREVLMMKDYAVDERVNDSRIVAFLKITESILNKDFLPLQFVFIFSILLSVLMEIGIVLAFDTVTVAMMPALQAQHKAAVEKEILKSEVAGAAEREGIRHESEMQRVAKRADRTIEEAESMVDKFNGQAA